MKLKDIQKIKLGDVIRDSTGWSYTVVEMLKHGIITVCAWKNHAGEFSKEVYFWFEDLQSDEYTLIQ